MDNNRLNRLEEIAKQHPLDLPTIDQVVRVVDYMARRVEEARAAHEEEAGALAWCERAHSYRRPSWDRWNELKDVYGEAPAHPELYEDPATHEDGGWEKHGRRIVDIWEDFYLFLCKFEMVDEEAQQLAREYCIDAPRLNTIAAEMRTEDEG